MKHIVISAKQQGGKTSTTNALKAKLAQMGYKPTTVPFAEPLKDGFVHAALAMGLITVDDANAALGNKDAAVKARFRPAFQSLGSTLRRYRPDTWVDIAADRIAALQAGNALVIVVNDDCRYPNEIERLQQKLGAFAVRLEASRELRLSRGPLVNEDHESETSLDHYTGWDLVIDQDKEPGITPEEMATRILNFLQLDGSEETYGDNAETPPTDDPLAGMTPEEKSEAGVPGFEV